ncbi:MAG: putative RNA uridine N3 methyltransferase [Acidilobaceae archaeon]
MLSPWPPPRRERRLSVALPGSVLSTEETLKLKTIKAGFVGRALAMFRVDEVILYRDEDTEEADLRLAQLLLEFMVTPPHLRKKVFPLSPQLSAAGLLPPLRLVTHDPPAEPAPGAKIEGLVVSCKGDLCKVFLGKLGTAVLLGRAEVGRRMTVVVKSMEPLVVEQSSWGKVYTGFEVRREDLLQRAIRRSREAGEAVIASSRLGRSVGEAAGELLSMVARARGALVVFGGPRLCPYEEAPHLFDMALNTVPYQGTFTVRTEEALYATLSALTNAGVL